MTDVAERTVSIAGKSGNAYTFAIYPFSHHFVHTRETVYVVGKSTPSSSGEPTITPTFFGETDDLRQRMEQHASTCWFVDNGDDVIAVYAVAAEALRIAIRRDLIGNRAAACALIDRCGTCPFS